MIFMIGVMYMDLRTLRYFVTVAEELNITHAAKKLNMSQPPLSSQLKSLEDELGVVLFIRGKRHLELTEAGTLLYRRAVQLLDLAEKTRNEVADMESGISGTISVGMVEGRGPFLAARFIAGFREEFPLVKFVMWNGSSDDVLDRLANGLVDVAVIAAPFDSERLESLPIGSEPWVAIIPVSNPLAEDDRKTIPLEKLKNQPLVVPSRRSRIRAIRDWFAEIEAEPDIVCETSSYIDAIAMSEQGVGISIFPQTTYTPNYLVKSKIIVDSERKIDYYLVWMKNRIHSPLVTEFLNFISDFTEEQQRNKVILPENEYTPAANIKSL